MRKVVIAKNMSSNNPSDIRILAGKHKIYQRKCVAKTSQWVAPGWFKERGRVLNESFKV